MMSMKEVAMCKGHANILATHKTTIEITKEKELTLAGDCIVGVGADKGMLELPGEFKERLRNGCDIEIVFECGGVTDVVRARGSGTLLLNHPTDIVIRKSDFADGRTLAVGADKAAVDLKRELVEKLRKGLELVVALSLN